MGYFLQCGKVVYQKIQKVLKPHEQSTGDDGEKIREDLKEAADELAEIERKDSKVRELANKLGRKDAEEKRRKDVLAQQSKPTKRQKRGNKTSVKPQTRKCKDLLAQQKSLSIMLKSLPDLSPEQQEGIKTQ